MAGHCSKRRDLLKKYVNPQAHFWSETILGLPLGPKSLLGFLARRSDKYGCCFFNKGTLADHLGCSPRSIQSHLRTLENYGLVRSIGRRDVMGQICNVYHVIGWTSRQQLPIRGHPTLGQYIKELPHAEFLKALKRQNSLPGRENSALHNTSHESTTTSAEEEMLETCLDALGSWISKEEKNLLSEDYISLFNLIDQGYGLNAHILPVLRKKAGSRRKVRLIRTWHYFAEAIAEYAAETDQQLEDAFRTAPPAKQAAPDPADEQAREALTQLYEEIRRTGPAEAVHGEIA